MLVRGKIITYFKAEKRIKVFNFPCFGSHDLVDVLPSETGSKCVSKLKC